MLLLRKSLAFLLLLFITNPVLSQLQVLGSTNAQALAQKLVGTGITISNVTMTASPSATGFFIHYGGTQLNLDSGIVLSSGYAQTTFMFGLNGPQVADASNDLFFPGDASLDALVAPNSTQDAAVLEFDFVPLGDSVKFRYVFSSEEYPEYVCSQWNDVFAFFISGPGITGTRNLAVVPGTNIPVTINSINSGSPGSAGSLPVCQAMGPGSPFSQYYISNLNNSHFTHDGYTKVLTAASAVTPCQVYHLKIAIADASDGILDSGVFLEAGSLKSDPIQIFDSLPVLNGYPYMVEGCQPGGIEIVRSRKSTTSMNVNLAFGGNAGNGTDVQTLPSAVSIPANDSIVFVPIVPIVDNIAEGTDTLKIYISNGCQLLNGYFLDSIIILIKDFDTLGVQPADTVVCKNAQVQLTANGNFTAIQWLPATGLNNNAIANPMATATVSSTYIATATLGSCTSVDSVKFRVKSLQLLSKADINCKNGTTGEIRVSGGDAWKAPVSYNINNQPYGTDSSFLNLPPGNYTVRVMDPTGCIDSIQVTLVQAFADLQLADSIVTASCTGINGQAILSASGGLMPYSYSIDGNSYASNNSFSITGGNHTLYVKDSNGCITQKPVVVNNDPAISFSTTPSQVLCDGSPSGYIYIHATGGSNQYEYSIDGVNFQQADSFLVSTSNITITVRDVKGCSATSNIAIPINQPVFVNAGNDTTICEGQSLQFNTVYNANSFSWNADPSLSATNIPNPVAMPVTSTTYYLTVTKDVCVAKDTVTVNVWPAPLANAGPDSTICFGKTIQLVGSGGTGYSWMPATAFVDPQSATPSIKPTQTTSYYLQVSDANGCTSLKYDTVTINVTPPIQAYAGVDTIVTVGQPLQLQGSDLGNSGANIYVWSPAVGLNDPNIQDPVATLNTDFTYTLTLSTPEGCEGSDKINIKVYEGPEIYVPTGFTPNGDGRNDVLRAIPVGMSKFLSFKVFNRWGQMVFSTQNQRMGWDGKISGKLQPTGTYVWLAEGLDYKGNKVFRKGVTTLIR